MIFHRSFSFQTPVTMVPCLLLVSLIYSITGIEATSGLTHMFVKQFSDSNSENRVEIDQTVVEFIHHNVTTYQPTVKNDIMVLLAI